MTSFGYPLLRLATAESGSLSWGANGGNGGYVSAVFRTDNIEQMTLRVGEGGVAAEANELGRGGEFGGGMGGVAVNPSSGWGNPDQASVGGGGGGYSAVLINGQPAVLAGGGGGGGGSAPRGEAGGGTGGHSTQFAMTARRGSSGFGTTSTSGAGGNSNGETFQSSGIGGPGATAEIGNNEEGMAGQNGIDFIGGNGGDNTINFPIYARGGPGGRWRC